MSSPATPSENSTGWNTPCVPEAPPSTPAVSGAAAGTPPAESEDNQPREQVARYTPGPWKWLGNATGNSLCLATTYGGRRYVMGFTRWGLQGAQPQFQPPGRGMIDASELLQFQVGDRDVVGVKEAQQNSSVYRMDVRGIDNADARLIAASPLLADALEQILPDKLCGESWDLPDSESVEITVTFGKLRAARAALAEALGAGA